MSINIFGFNFIGLPIFTAWQALQNRHRRPARRRQQTGAAALETTVTAAVIVAPLIKRDEV